MSRSAYGATKSSKPSKTKLSSLLRCDPCRAPVAGMQRQCRRRCRQADGRRRGDVGGRGRIVNVEVEHRGRLASKRILRVRRDRAFDERDGLRRALVEHPAIPGEALQPRIEVGIDGQQRLQLRLVPLPVGIGVIDQVGSARAPRGDRSRRRARAAVSPRRGERRRAFGIAGIWYGREVRREESRSAHLGGGFPKRQ